MQHIERDTWGEGHANVYETRVFLLNTESGDIKCLVRYQKTEDIKKETVQARISVSLMFAPITLDRPKIARSPLVI